MKLNVKVREVRVIARLQNILLALLLPLSALVVRRLFRFDDIGFVRSVCSFSGRNEETRATKAERTAAGLDFRCDDGGWWW